MTTIAQLLNTKGNQIWSVEPKATIFKALEIMSEKKNRCFACDGGWKAYGHFFRTGLRTESNPERQIIKRDTGRRIDDQKGILHRFSKNYQ